MAWKIPNLSQRQVFLCTKWSPCTYLAKFEQASPQVKGPCINYETRKIVTAHSHSPVVLHGGLLHLLDPLLLLPLGRRVGRAPPPHLRQPPLRVRKVLRAALVRHDRLEAMEEGEREP